MSNFDFKSVKKQPADFRQINMILQKAGNSLVSSEAILKDDPESAFVRVRSAETSYLAHGTRFPYNPISGRSPVHPPSEWRNLVDALG
ncbi:MAG: hypothetical protein ACYDG7_03995 [Thermoleophilia bacterium]